MGGKLRPSSGVALGKPGGPWEGRAVLPGTEPEGEGQRQGRCGRARAQTVALAHRALPTLNGQGQGAEASSEGAKAPVGLLASLPVFLPNHRASAGTLDSVLHLTMSP